MALLHTPRSSTRLRREREEHRITMFKLNEDKIINYQHMKIELLKKFGRKNVRGYMAALHKIADRDNEVATVFNKVISIS